MDNRSRLGPIRLVDQDEVPPSGLARGGQRRTDWAAHRALVREQNAARQRAIRLLMLRHEAEFMELYRQAGQEVDPVITPKGIKPRTARDVHLEVAGAVAWMQAELVRLHALLDEAKELGDG